TLDVLKIKRAAAPFGHGAEHKLASGATLFSSYHCSRYNTIPGRLTVALFIWVFERNMLWTG
ncbi:MAG: uracil-DNA glycosylase, partial [Ferrovibrio sp.]